MTWEETIIYIRKNPDYQYLVENAYLDADLTKNIESFKQSEEFSETLKLIRQNSDIGKKGRLLDIGCGNGISAISFALEGFEVVALEPDPSLTVGAGAIRKLAEIYNLKNIKVYEAFAEDIAFESGSFDIVYARQAVHHAHDLTKFITEAGRVLKKDGLLLTIRDHVIYNDIDKKWFLENHPLQKLYGGENAFTATEYRNAMQNAGLTIIKELKLYDSVINYFPISKKRQFLLNLLKATDSIWQNKLIKKITPGVIDNMIHQITDEAKVPGRIYSYIAQKSF